MTKTAMLEIRDLGDASCTNETHIKDSVGEIGPSQANVEGCLSCSAAYEPQPAAGVMLGAFPAAVVSHPPTESGMK